MFLFFAPFISANAKTINFNTVVGLTNKTSVKSVKMQKGSSIQIISVNGRRALPSYAVKYTSNNKKVAKVSKTGRIVALKTGTAKITIKYNNGKKKSVIKIRVTEKLKVLSVNLDKNSLSLKIGEIQNLKATTNPQYATNNSVVWSSSDESVATVKNGTVTGLAKGKTTITATIGKHSAACVVKVTSKKMYPDPEPEPNPEITPDPSFDPVYDSMTLPSEAMSDFSKSCGRYYGRILNNITPTQTQALSIGAVYLESGKKMSQDFTVCIGKIALYAYSISQKKWIAVSERPYPGDPRLYQLPWSTHINYKCQNVEYFNNHVEVRLTPEQIEGFALHFWGQMRPIDHDDFKYYACAYEIWVKEDYASNILTTEGGIDAKDNNSQNGIQLLSSRSLSLTTRPKVCWCHTIPNREYEYSRDGKQLMKLFNQ